MQKCVPGRVSIITLNWHHYRDLTGPFIRYIEHWTPGDIQLIVVDQESQRPDADLLTEDASLRKWLWCLALPINVGFPKGNNEGLALASGEYIVIMNNDITIHGPWLEPCLQVLYRDPKAIVGASLIDKGGWNEFRRDGRYINIPYLEGWLLAMHRSVIEDLGHLFEESYGAGGMEDVEFCWRAAAKGYRLVEIPNLPLVHLRGKTVTDGRLDQDSITQANHDALERRVWESVE